MALYNVSFTDVDVERTVTVEVESEEIANYVVKAAYGRDGYEWDGVVTEAPEPPETVLDADNVEHPNYREFAGAQVDEPVGEPEAEGDIVAE